MWNWTWLEQLGRDVAAGRRLLTRSPGLSAASVMLLALVIGGNTTIYSMVHTVLSKPAPGVTARGLVTLTQSVDGGPPSGGLSFPDYADYARLSTTVRPLLAMTFSPFAIALADGSYAVRGASVTPNYFETVGVSLALGRTFTEDEHQLRGTGLVAIVGYRIWRDHFKASAVLGASIGVNGHPATIVGVVPDGFRGLGMAEQAEIWVPLVAYARLTGATAPLEDRGDRKFWVIGRLAPDAALAMARAEFAVLSARASARGDAAARSSILPVRYSMTAGGDNVVAQRVPQFLAVFSVVTAITLLIVCANVSNLMLGRVIVRGREFAVRLALGASRGRVVRLLLAEGLVLAFCGWVSACATAWWMSAAIPALLNAPVLIDFTPDWTVIGYAALLAIAAAVTFTMVPAAHVWRRPLLVSLKPGEHGIVGGRSRVSNVLAILQVSFCVLLLTAAGLGYRSLSFLAANDLGFEPHHLVLVRVNTAASAGDGPENRALLERIREGLSRVNGVAGATQASTVPPYTGGRAVVRSDPGGGPMAATTISVGPSFFGLAGVRVLGGHDFTVADVRHPSGVAVINQNMAADLWPGQSAVGRRMFVDQSREPIEIVGVVANALLTGARTEAHPYFIYFPAGQRGGEPGRAWFYVRRAGDAGGLAQRLRTALKELDPRVPIETMVTMDEALKETVAPVRLVTTLLGLFAVGSLIIAGLGLYAVIAFNMGRRVRELGLRIALGASSAQVLSGVLCEGAVMTGTGLAVGFVLSVGVAFLARTTLVGVTPADPWTYGVVLAVLAGVSLAASYLPARRAASVDPVVALRHE